MKHADPYDEMDGDEFEEHMIGLLTKPESVRFHAHSQAATKPNQSSSRRCPAALSDAHERDP